MKRSLLRVLSLASAALASVAASFIEPVLVEGVHDMYNLSFAKAHARFERWEKAHPEDPRGPVFDAAAYLYAEFDRLHILQSQFFMDDRNFSGVNRPAADAQIKQAFTENLTRAQRLAEIRLQNDPRDENALFALVLRYGLAADYDALIEKENLTALGETKHGTEIAKRLLALYPDCYDAHLAGGIENYLLSQKPAPVRWILHVTGAETDEQRGVENLKIVAEKGTYLKPYAKMLLAVAALRDHNRREAERWLAELAAEFPQNQPFRQELAKSRASH